MKTRHPLNKRVRDLLIAGAFILLAVFWVSVSSDRYDITQRREHTPQAILQSTATNTTHIITLGSNLNADTQVVDIQLKQVTLSTQGQQRTLMPLSGF